MKKAARVLVKKMNSKRTRAETGDGKAPLQARRRRGSDGKADDKTNDKTGDKTGGQAGATSGEKISDQSGE